jgi:hypothetical protein
MEFHCSSEKTISLLSNFKSRSLPSKWSFNLGINSCERSCESVIMLELEGFLHLFGRVVWRTPYKAEEIVVVLH